MTRERTVIGGNYWTTNTTQFYYNPDGGFTKAFGHGIFSSFSNSSWGSQYIFIDAGTLKSQVVNCKLATGGTGVTFSIYKSEVLLAGSEFTIVTTGITENILDEPMAEGDLILMGSKGVGATTNWFWRLGIVGEYD